MCDTFSVVSGILDDGDDEDYQASFRWRSQEQCLAILERRMRCYFSNTLFAEDYISYNILLYWKQF